MRQREVPLGMKMLLFALFFLGFLFNVLIVLDVGWLHLALAAAELRPDRPASRAGAETPATGRDALRQGVMLVAVDRCDGSGQQTGTGFVVDDGLVITCDHLVGEHLSCNSEIRLLDHRGRQLRAELDAYSDTQDLALLRIDDTSVPALPLAESGRYEEAAGTGVFTVGYPQAGTASPPGEASFSATGSLQQYRPDDDLFIAAGLGLLPGMSGGPVVLADELRVLGIALDALDGAVGDGLGYVIPSETVKAFFLEKTGRVLR